MAKIRDLFNLEKGTLQSSKCNPGTYDFITASKDWKTHNEFTHECEALIFAAAASGSLGRTHYVYGKFSTSDLCIVLTPKDEFKYPLDIKFYHIIFNTLKDDIVKNTKAGTSKEAIGLRALGDYDLPYIDYEQQREVAKRFNNATDLSDKLNSEFISQLSLIKDLRQAFLREAMQGKLVSNETCDGKTGADLLHEIIVKKEKLIKEKKLKKGKITKNSKKILELKTPENWMLSKLDDLFFVTKLAGFEYTDHMLLKEIGDVPVIRAQNVRNLTIDRSNLLYIDIKTSFLLDRCSLNKECLLITFIGAGIGDVATFNEEIRWHLAPNVAKAEPFVGIEELYIIKYFNYYLISDYGRSEIKKHMKATAQPSLSMETIRDIDIPLPPLEIQKRIVSELDVLMKYCNELENSIKESQKYNEQLLQQVLREALEGKNDIEDDQIQLVAEESPIYSILSYQIKNCDTGDMAILAGYIIKNLSTQNAKDFGRVKLQKMLHLIEYHCQLSSELQYQKNVAGPYAWELEHVIEPKLKSLRFFEIKKDKFGTTSKVTYTPLSASKEIPSLFKNEFKDQAESINHLLDKFQDKTWEFCEMISTMYAVWNNRLIRKELFTEDILKQDFLAWDDKKRRFIDQLDYALEWIRREKIEPVGFGEYIDKNNR